MVDLLFDAREPVAHDDPRRGVLAGMEIAAQQGAVLGSELDVVAHADPLWSSRHASGASRSWYDDATVPETSDREAA